MTRMGHDSMRAALIYQHRTQGADSKIANALEGMLAEYQKAIDEPGEDPDDGTAGALVPA